MTEREEEGPKRLITDDSCYTNKKLCIDMEEMNGIVNRSEDNSSDNTSKTSIDNCEEKPELFNGVEISKLTKRQQKKYNKMLKWQEVKKEKRAKERLKLKEKKVHAKLNNIDLGPSRKELKRMKMANSPCKISICLDLSFDDLMIDKDMAKTIKQILRVYTENRRAKEPMQLHLTSFNGRSKNEMSKHHGYENWDINFHCEDYMNVFPKDKLVYLTSESDNIINKLESDKVYIIGGLVDHNFHKGVCYKKALEQGIAHGQLPISEYFWMKHRKVFTINQVFEILLRVSEGRNFKEAFEMILPKRINMQPSTKTNSELEESEVPSESS
ncbi:tRNA methyltransferase 10 homolog A [Harmonia axyridis]|uniref:tRNA methyltransferase 10 homolog A n=1 Tax=Harmonia axyridis TaxID=115357 RepID=UPI001E275979|nr:tRNA methyltransferase 10 homolog A [Harmonia axyridis]